jgi:hypothetical protein
MLRYLALGLFAYSLFFAKRWKVTDRDGRVYVVDFGDSVAEFYSDPGIYDQTDYFNRSELMDVFRQNDPWMFLIYPTGGKSGLLFNAQTGEYSYTYR